MVFDNPLRQALTEPVFGDVAGLAGGMLEVPQRPGLGVALRPGAVEAFLIRD